MKKAKKKDKHGDKGARKGELWNNWIALQSIVRLAVWITIFYYILKLRKKVAKLPKNQLSSFLLKTILTRGLAALVPMIFFSFETLSCFSVYSLSAKKVCRSSSAASFYLSLYLSGFLLLSILNR